MEHDFISGIQQIGIGVKNTTDAAQRYKNGFGMTTLVFDDTAPAKLMTKFTGGNVHQRHALLTMNMKGGGGFELWQFLDVEPTENLNVRYGDLGIFAAIIKTSDLIASHKKFSIMNGFSAKPIINIDNESSFYTKDVFGNNFKIVLSDAFFQKMDSDIGGVLGAVIGVSNMDKSILFYKKLLGTVNIVRDSANENFRTVVIYKRATNVGAFSKLLGDIKIELVQDLKNKRQHIYRDRFWGDCGFIHLCFDVTGMDRLKRMMENDGHLFAVDSSESFEMNKASGRFCYVEDPDGTLIELVETHRVPIIKNLGLFLDLQKRKIKEPLPDWMIKLMSLSKVP